MTKLQPLKTTNEAVADSIAETFRLESRKVISVLLATLCDIELAEDALQDALVSALQRWSIDGIPQNPGAWIMTTARRKVIDRLRSSGAFERNLAVIEAASAFERDADEADDSTADAQIPDERLKLMFTCCHPALSQEAQVALTLQTLGGLTTAEIAHSFLVSETTMAQRLVRAKRKIRDAGVPYQVPSIKDIPERLNAILTVIYLIFNAGYAASQGDQVLRHDLCEEAIRLGRVLNTLLSQEQGIGAQAEALGLLALMILHHARRQARVSEDGALIVLDEQDRALWIADEIEEGIAILDRALALGQRGAYQIQAAISALHTQARRPEETDWNQIALLYHALYDMQPTPVIGLNRAVAFAMATDALKGLYILEQFVETRELRDYFPYHAARADLLRRAGRLHEAADAYTHAQTLTNNRAEQEYLKRRLSALASIPNE